MKMINIGKILKNWFLPLIVSLGLFLLVRPVLAQSLEPSKITSVGTENIDGYTQVFYEEGGTRHIITSGNISSRMPAFAGNFIVYVSDINGEGQVYLYDSVSSTKTQLTFIGTNLNPKVDEKGRVVWEGWAGETWQIFFFDGKSIKQLTTGDTSLNPYIWGDYITYGRRDLADTWRAVIYSMTENKSVDVTTGEKARKPGIKNGEVYLAMDGLNEEKFPLKVSDLFLLDMVQVNESTPSANPIIEELSATPSGVMEIPIATESGELGI